MAEWIKKQNPSIYCLQEIHLIFKVSDNFRGKGQAKVFQPGRTSKQGVSTLINDKKRPQTKTRRFKDLQCIIIKGSN